MGLEYDFDIVTIAPDEMDPAGEGSPLEVESSGACVVSRHQNGRCLTCGHRHRRSARCLWMRGSVLKPETAASRRMVTAAEDAGGACAYPAQSVCQYQEQGPCRVNTAANSISVAFSAHHIRHRTRQTAVAGTLSARTRKRDQRHRRPSQNRQAHCARPYRVCARVGGHFVCPVQISGSGGRGALGQRDTSVAHGLFCCGK